jgi:hypothetical protein
MVGRGDRDAGKSEAEDGEERTERASLREAGHPPTLLLAMRLAMPESCPSGHEYNPTRQSRPGA